MKYKKLLFIFVGILAVGLLAIGLFAGNITQTVFGGSELTPTTDNVKVYDEVTKTVTLKDKTEKEIANVQLLTPIKNKVGVGYKLVAKLKITNTQDSSEIYDLIKFYNVKDGMKELNITFDFMFEEDVKVIVDDYGDVNVSLGKYKKINQTDELINYWSNTNELLCQEDINTNELFGCDYITGDKSVWQIQQEVIGNHLEMQPEWKLFDKLKNKENILAGEYTVGIFTETYEGQKVEWIPTFLGEEISEWAEWEVYTLEGLSTYYKASAGFSVAQIRSLAISPDGNYLATSSSTRDEISIMNITNKSEIVELANYYDTSGAFSVDTLYSLTFSPDGNYLATSSSIEDYVSIMNITNKSEIVPLVSYTDIDGDFSVETIRSLAFSPDGNYLITSSNTDSYVSIMDITNKSEIVPLVSYTDIDGDFSTYFIASLSISPDGNYLATSSFTDDYVSIMNITNKSEIVPLATYTDSLGNFSIDGIYSLAFSPDGNYLATSSSTDSYVSIMDITNKSEMVPLVSYYDTSGAFSVETIYSLAFSPDGNYLATSSYTDNIVSIMQFTDSNSSTDTCTYSGSGDWNITMSDYCVINDDTDVTTNDIIFYGAGNVTFNATIEAANLGQPINNGNIYIDSNARLILG